LTEIGFYHLTRTGLAHALPKLLGRTLAAGKRALVLCVDENRAANLDKALWDAPEPDWLPHGTPADGDPDLQPVWLDVDDAAPNGASFLFLTGGAETARLNAFERVFDLFDGNEQAELEAARRRWKAAKAAGHALTYWQEGERGWQKKA